MRDGSIHWEEVQEAASKMFKVWINGAELKWAQESWGHLRAAGLTNGNTVLETTAARLRLVTLGRIYEEFCRLAWEENPETPLEYLAEFLEIDPVALGILASTGSTDDITDAIDEFGLRVAALQAATDSQRKVIFQCLEAAYGGPVKLFSRLWHTRADAAEADDDLPEFEPVPGNCSALEYVQNGFLLG